MEIKAYCKLTNNGIFLNGNKIIDFEKDETNWKKNAYLQLEIEYPKFHKMDSISKLAFLAVNYLEKIHSFDSYTDDEVNLIFANKNSSYCSDINHFNNYTQKKILSPSDFVYTLPNILIGEIAIQKKWFGENCFFILDEFDIDFFISQINIYFCNSSNVCLCGWIESNENYEEAIMFVVENNETKKIDINQFKNMLK